MKTPQNRFLLELDRLRRDINRQVLKPRIDDLDLTKLTPVINAVAHARADYVDTLLRIGKAADNLSPTQEQIEELRVKREAYDELVSAANALETIIQRDYIDVVSQKP